ncbi:MAG: heavy-metal-associated domain-containing protein [Bacilli bacterium]|jgi:copper chaperone CopZ|nr:cation transporter [Bacillota bacterium]MDD4188303.1 heavy-metal-associated domain-containing protein [Bacilli bacterium]
MKKTTIQLETLSCPSCLQKINNAVKGLKGVDKESVDVMFNASKVKLNFDEAQVDIATIENAITKLGYDVKNSRVSDL